MLIYSRVDLIRNAPFDEGISEGQGGTLGVVEGRGGMPHRQLRDLMLVDAGFRGHKAVLIPLVLGEHALGGAQDDQFPQSTGSIAMLAQSPGEVDPRFEEPRCICESM